MPATALIGRPASCGLRGACLRPRAIRARMGRASCPPRGRLTPHEHVGGVRRPRADRWPPLRGPRVWCRTPPRPPVPGGCGGWLRGRSPVVARPFPRRPSRRQRQPRSHAASARLAPGSSPASRRAAPARPFRAGLWLARAPRPRPSRAAGGRPWPPVRGLHRAASVRPVRLIIHIFTVPEIPYFTGFSSRQARCFLVQ